MVNLLKGVSNHTMFLNAVFKKKEVQESNTRSKCQKKKKSID